MIGVIMATQYNLKRDRELFGECVNEAVMNELSENYGLENHEPQII